MNNESANLRAVAQCLGNELYSYVTASFNPEDLIVCIPSTDMRMKHVASTVEAALTHHVDQMLDDGTSVEEILAWRNRVDPMLDLALEKLKNWLE